MGKSAHAHPFNLIKKHFMVIDLLTECQAARMCVQCTVLHNRLTCEAINFSLAPAIVATN